MQFTAHKEALVDLGSPMSSVVPSAHGPVLAVLARTHAPLTGRTIAELTRPRKSQRQVATVLAALADAGVVLRERLGSAHLYALNRDHVAADAIESLATLRDQLWARMAAAVSGWEPAPEAVAVFGSAARGDGSATSDIDVLVVRHESVGEDDPRWQAQLESFAALVARWSGNACEILEHTPNSLGALAASGERLVSELRQDAVFLCGDRAVLPRRTGTGA